jgi:hypothetical protein
LFGLALTPVFFGTIDWLGETHFFKLPWVRRIGSFGMDVLSLRPVRNAAVRWTQRLAEAARRRPPQQRPQRPEPSTTEVR